MSFYVFFVWIVPIPVYVGSMIQFHSIDQNGWRLHYNRIGCWCQPLDSWFLGFFFCLSTWCISLLYVDYSQFLLRWCSWSAVVFVGPFCFSDRSKFLSFVIQFYSPRTEWQKIMLWWSRRLVSITITDKLIPWFASSLIHLLCCCCFRSCPIHRLFQFLT